MPFLPSDHPIPPGLEHPRFRVRPITVNDVVRDYDAVMTSAEHLRSHFPLWGWPPEDMTLESDLVDLGWHQREALLRRSFNYAVMSRDEQRLLGCVYIDPPEKAGADADVAFWVRADALGSGMEEELEAAVRAWLERDWPFRDVRWPGRDISWEAWDALPEHPRYGG
jgi:hypothetical protein